MIDEVIRCCICNANNKTMDILPNSNIIKCNSCGAIYKQHDDDFFYYFNSNIIQTYDACQLKGLLENQGPIAYTNDIFKRVTIGIILQELRRCIADLKCNIILDIGCGNGQYAYNLENQYERYYGIEPSPIPSDYRLASSPNPNITLIHNDAKELLPIHANSVDMVTFIASFDHIPNPRIIIADAWSKLRKKGYLLILMQNYGFWPKRLINLFVGKQLFKDFNEHHCYHTPASLIKDISSFLPNAKIGSIKFKANIVMFPRIPKSLSFIYFDEKILYKIDNILSFISSKILKREDLGAIMIVFLQKCDDT